MLLRDEPKQMADQAGRLTCLSPARQALIRFCQALNHGSVEELRIINGEPVLDGSSVIVNDVKLDSDEAPRPEVALADFVLSDEVVRLMRQLDRMGDGVIRRIEIRGGIPRRILVATRFSDAIEQAVK